MNFVCHPQCIYSTARLSVNCYLKGVSSSRTTGRRFKGTLNYEKGYVILAPDIPSDTPETNHLLETPREEETPKYSLLRPRKCFRAFVKRALEFEACIDDIELLEGTEGDSAKQFDQFYGEIEKSLVPLDYCYSNIKLLHQTKNTRFNFPNIETINRNFGRSRGRRTTSHSIYDKMKEFNINRSQLNDVQKRIVDKYMLEAKLNGLDLAEASKSSLDKVYTQLAQFKQRYRDNVEEATRRFRHQIADPSMLRLFPDNFLAAVGTESRATITLSPSVYGPFMEYCPDRTLRWNVWLAYNMRASPQNDRSINNSIIIEEIRSKKQEQARILGYKSYAELSMETKMAGSVDVAKSMINTLHAKSRDPFNDDLKELITFASESNSFDGSKLELWDIDFLQRKLIKAKFGIVDDVVSQYFPMPAVLKGMFDMTGKLFQVHIEEVQRKDFDPWDEDVRLFRVISPNGFAGSFFFDPYSRPADKIEKKYWVEPILNRSQPAETMPLTILNLNLSRPLLKNKPVLLNFNDVLTLFKGFGQILRHTLSEGPYSEVNGLNNSEWDTIKLCPDFMALWPLHDYNTIAACSSHSSSGQPLPLELHQQIREAHYKFYSFQLSKDLYRSALDLSLYSNSEFWGDIVDEIWKNYMQPFSMDKNDTHLCSFREIMCDEYSAAFYGFKWSEMLAADIFCAFREAKTPEDLEKTGLKFRDIFLSNEGGEATRDSFRRFRGRDPSPDSLLELSGLLRNDTSTGSTASGPRTDSRPV